MNKIFIILFALIAFNVSAVYAKKCKPKAEVKELKLDKYGCYTGGPGSDYCEIPAGLKFKEGISRAGSVTCQPGYFACCAYRCRCIPNPQKKIINNQKQLL